MTHPNTGSISHEDWGFTPDGRPVTLYHLHVPGGLQASITNYGGVVVRLLVPDREGTLGDVVLGHDRVEPYFDRATSPFFGALIGRYGNRIAKGRFQLKGRTYQLEVNNGPNTLHGGERGFDQRLWNAHASSGPEGPTLTLTYRSADGEEGFPGTLHVRVAYTLTPDSLGIEYHATSDAPTIVNLTNHSYFNLTGRADCDVLDHELQVHADHITPVDETLIPTGNFLPVDGTPFDFREAHAVGARVNADHPQLHHAGGYDHNFVLNGDGFKPAAVLYDPGSGRQLEVRTTQPGMQVYSGNFLDGSITGKNGQRYGHRWAVCLETQHYPDSPNQPNFPSTVLQPGQEFSSRTVYAFSTR